MSARPRPSFRGAPPLTADSDRSVQTEEGSDAASLSIKLYVQGYAPTPASGQKAVAPIKRERLTSVQAPSNHESRRSGTNLRGVSQGLLQFLAPLFQKKKLPVTIHCNCKSPQKVHSDPSERSVRLYLLLTCRGQQRRRLLGCYQTRESTRRCNLPPKQVQIPITEKASALQRAKKKEGKPA
jgi:hypothetical protein